MQRVAIVADVEGWAWHRRACGIRDYAPPEYRVDVYTIDTWQKRPGLVKQYDAILSMSMAECGIVDHPRQWTMIANEGVMHPHVKDLWSVEHHAI